MTDPRLSVDPPDKSSISFHISPASEEVIRIDAEGFHYRGQFIADAGEAHRLLIGFMRKHQSNTETLQPVSVAERLPRPEDCDEWRYWIWNSINKSWGVHSLSLKPLEFQTHWLPAHALPLPNHD